MKRELAIEFSRVTEAAALAGYKWLGRGDKNTADGAAVHAMRIVLNQVNIDGTIVIGEGEIDEAPMLYIGEKVGTGKGDAVDIAVDPIEGTRMTAMGQAKLGIILLACCWAHVRRVFIGVGKGWPELVDWAIGWLHRIRELYQINRQRLSHQPKTPEFALHDAALREAIDAMHQQATEELAQPKLREPCRKALASLLDHWSGLTLFVDDPKIPMDNNASERAVRGPAMSRKNYYGSGSLWSACLTAAMFSIVATLKQWGLNPRRWLSWYLESCAAAGSRVPEDIERFLPWNLTAESRAELTSPEASVPINDSS